MQAPQNELPVWHGTTILTVRKGGRVVIGGDGQVSMDPPLTFFHTYAKTGTYVATVNATTSDGRTAISYVGVTVRPSIAN